ncbi:MAG: VWA domain-containing protein [Salinicola sp.]|uniref:VWA domain-containing protein n=1 Tax=Salinicola sp. TaxID=1978524 RepID=UPI001DEF6FFB|nr:VWA domain-containing protein [Salinicola sp.]NRB56173.1 VWA domain-containing protein [Salinicola sp.]
MIELAAPWILLLLPLPLLVHWLVPAYKRRMAALRLPFFQRYVQAAGIAPAAGAQVMSRSRILSALALLCWCLLVVALARPERVSAPIHWQTSARDLILAVDISGSMDEKDFAASDDETLQRLAGVKRVIAGFLGDREGERLALIVFGTQAFVQSPLTTDLDTLQALLARTEVGMAGPHTALGDAIGLAIRQFDASDVSQRLLILLSDGADTGSRMSPINAASIAADRDVQIITIAIGDPQGNGENRVDTDTLEAIADTTGGTSFLATDEQALRQVYDRIDELAPRQIADHSYRERQSLAAWPMGVALVLVLLAWLWRSVSLGRRRLS